MTLFRIKIENSRILPRSYLDDPKPNYRLSQPDFRSKIATISGLAVYIKKSCDVLKSFTTLNQH